MPFTFLSFEQQQKREKWTKVSKTGFFVVFVSGQPKCLTCCCCCYFLCCCCCEDIQISKAQKGILRLLVVIMSSFLKRLFPTLFLFKILPQFHNLCHTIKKHLTHFLQNMSKFSYIFCRTSSTFATFCYDLFCHLLSHFLNCCGIFVNKAADLKPVQ